MTLLGLFQTCLLFFSVAFLIVPFLLSLLLPSLIRRFPLSKAGKRKLLWLMHADADSGAANGSGDVEEAPGLSQEGAPAPIARGFVSGVSSEGIHSSAADDLQAGSKDADDDEWFLTVTSVRCAGFLRFADVSLLLERRSTDGGEYRRLTEAPSRGACAGYGESYIAPTTRSQSFPRPQRSPARELATNDGGTCVSADPKSATADCSLFLPSARIDIDDVKLRLRYIPDAHPWSAARLRKNRLVLPGWKSHVVRSVNDRCRRAIELLCPQVGSPFLASLPAWIHGHIDHVRTLLCQPRADEAQSPVSDPRMQLPSCPAAGASEGDPARKNADCRWTLRLSLECSSIGLHVAVGRDGEAPSECATRSASMPHVRAASRDDVETQRSREEAKHSGGRVRTADPRTAAASTRVPSGDGREGVTSSRRVEQGRDSADSRSVSIPASSPVAASSSNAPGSPCETPSSYTQAEPDAHASREETLTLPSSQPQSPTSAAAYENSFLCSQPVRSRADGVHMLFSPKGAGRMSGGGPLGGGAADSDEARTEGKQRARRGSALEAARQGSRDGGRTGPRRAPRYASPLSQSVRRLQSASAAESPRAAPSPLSPRVRRRPSPPDASAVPPASLFQSVLVLCIVHVVARSCALRVSRFQLSILVSASYDESEEERERRKHEREEGFHLGERLAFSSPFCASSACAKRGAHRDPLVTHARSTSPATASQFAEAEEASSGGCADARPVSPSDASRTTGAWRRRAERRRVPCRALSPASLALPPASSCGVPSDLASAQPHASISACFVLAVEDLVVLPGGEFAAVFVDLAVKKRAAAHVLHPSTDFPRLLPSDVASCVNPLPRFLATAFPCLRAEAEKGCASLRAGGRRPGHDDHPPAPLQAHGAADELAETVQQASASPGLGCLGSFLSFYTHHYGASASTLLAGLSSASTGTKSSERAASFQRLLSPASLGSPDPAEGRGFSLLQSSWMSDGSAPPSAFRPSPLKAPSAFPLCPRSPVSSSLLCRELAAAVASAATVFPPLFVTTAIDIGVCFDTAISSRGNSAVFSRAFASSPSRSAARDARVAPQLLQREDIAATLRRRSRKKPWSVCSVRGVRVAFSSDLLLNAHLNQVGRLFHLYWACVASYQLRALDGRQAPQAAVAGAAAGAGHAAQLPGAARSRRGGCSLEQLEEGAGELRGERAEELAAAEGDEEAETDPDEEEVDLETRELPVTVSVSRAVVQVFERSAACALLLEASQVSVQLGVEKAHVLICPRVLLQQHGEEEERLAVWGRNADGYLPALERSGPRAFWGGLHSSVQSLGGLAAWRGSGGGLSARSAARRRSSGSPFSRAAALRRQPASGGRDRPRAEDASEDEALEEEEAGTVAGPDDGGLEGPPWRAPRLLVRRRVRYAATALYARLCLASVEAPRVPLPAPPPPGLGEAQRDAGAPEQQTDAPASRWASPAAPRHPPQALGGTSSSDCRLPPPPTPSCGGGSRVELLHAAVLRGRSAAVRVIGELAGLRMEGSTQQKPSWRQNVRLTAAAGWLLWVEKGLLYWLMLLLHLKTTWALQKKNAKLRLAPPTDCRAPPGAALRAKKRSTGTSSSAVTPQPTAERVVAVKEHGRRDPPESEGQAAAPGSLLSPRRSERHEASEARQTLGHGEEASAPRDAKPSRPGVEARSPKSPAAEGGAEEAEPESGGDRLKADFHQEEEHSAKASALRKPFLHEVAPFANPVQSDASLSTLLDAEEDLPAFEVRCRQSFHARFFNVCIFSPVTPLPSSPPSSESAASTPRAASSSEVAPASSAVSARCGEPTPGTREESPQEDAGGGRTDAAGGNHTAGRDRRGGDAEPLEPRAGVLRLVSNVLVVHASDVAAATVIAALPLRAVPAVLAPQLPQETAEKKHNGDPDSRETPTAAAGAAAEPRAGTEAPRASAARREEGGGAVDGREARVTRFEPFVCQGRLLGSGDVPLKAGGRMFPPRQAQRRPREGPAAPEASDASPASGAEREWRSVVDCAALLISLPQAPRGVSVQLSSVRGRLCEKLLLPLQSLLGAAQFDMMTHRLAKLKTDVPTAAGAEPLVSVRVCDIDVLLASRLALSAERVLINIQPSRMPSASALSRSSSITASPCVSASFSAYAAPAALSPSCAQTSHAGDLFPQSVPSPGSSCLSPLAAAAPPRILRPRVDVAVSAPLIRFVSVASAAAPPPAGPSPRPTCAGAAERGAASTKNALRSFAGGSAGPGREKKSVHPHVEAPAAPDVRGALKSKNGSSRLKSSFSPCVTYEVLPLPPLLKCATVRVSVQLRRPPKGLSLQPHHAPAPRGASRRPRPESGLPPSNPELAPSQPPASDCRRATPASPRSAIPPAAVEPSDVGGDAAGRTRDAPVSGEALESSPQPSSELATLVGRLSSPSSAVCPLHASAGCAASAPRRGSAREDAGSRGASAVAWQQQRVCVLIIGCEICLPPPGLPSARVSSGACVGGPDAEDRSLFSHLLEAVASPALGILRTMHAAWLLNSRFSQAQHGHLALTALAASASRGAGAPSFFPVLFHPSGLSSFSASPARSARSALSSAPCGEQPPADAGAEACCPPEAGCASAFTAEASWLFSGPSCTLCADSMASFASPRGESPAAAAAAGSLEAAVAALFEGARARALLEGQRRSPSSPPTAVELVFRDFQVTVLAPSSLGVHFSARRPSAGSASSPMCAFEDLHAERALAAERERRWALPAAERGVVTGADLFLLLPPLVILPAMQAAIRQLRVSEAAEEAKALNATVASSRSATVCVGRSPPLPPASPPGSSCFLAYSPQQSVWPRVCPPLLLFGVSSASVGFLDEHTPGCAYLLRTAAAAAVAPASPASLGGSAAPQSADLHGASLGSGGCPRAAAGAAARGRSDLSRGQKKEPGGSLSPCLFSLPCAREARGEAAEDLHARGGTARPVSCSTAGSCDADFASSLQSQAWRLGGAEAPPDSGAPSFARPSLVTQVDIDDLRLLLFSPSPTTFSPPSPSPTAFWTQPQGEARYAKASESRPRHAREPGGSRAERNAGGAPRDTAAAESSVCEQVAAARKDGEAEPHMGVTASPAWMFQASRLHCAFAKQQGLRRLGIRGSYRGPTLGRGDNAPPHSGQCLSSGVIPSSSSTVCLPSTGSAVAQIASVGCDSRLASTVPATGHSDTEALEILALAVDCEGGLQARCCASLLELGAATVASLRILQSLWGASASAEARRLLGVAQREAAAYRDRELEARRHARIVAATELAVASAPLLPAAALYAPAPPASLSRSALPCEVLFGAAWARAAREEGERARAKATALQASQAAAAARRLTQTVLLDVSLAAGAEIRCELHRVPVLRVSLPQAAASARMQLVWPPGLRGAKQESTEEEAATPPRRGVGGGAVADAALEKDAGSRRAEKRLRAAGRLQRRAALAGSAREQLLSATLETRFSLREGLQVTTMMTTAGETPTPALPQRLAATAGNEAAMHAPGPLSSSASAGGASRAMPLLVHLAQLDASLAAQLCAPDATPRLAVASDGAAAPSGPPSLLSQPEKGLPYAWADVFAGGAGGRERLGGREASPSRPGEGLSASPSSRALPLPRRRHLRLSLQAQVKGVRAPEPEETVGAATSRRAAVHGWAPSPKEEKQARAAAGTETVQETRGSLRDSGTDLETQRHAEASRRAAQPAVAASSFRLTVNCLPEHVALLLQLVGTRAAQQQLVRQLQRFQAQVAREASPAKDEFSALDALSRCLQENLTAEIFLHLAASDLHGKFDLARGCLAAVEYRDTIRIGFISSPSSCRAFCSPRGGVSEEEARASRASLSSSTSRGAGGAFSEDSDAPASTASTKKWTDAERRARAEAPLCSARGRNGFLSQRDASSARELRESETGDRREVPHAWEILDEEGNARARRRTFRKLKCGDASELKGARRLKGRSKHLYAGDRRGSGRSASSYDEESTPPGGEAWRRRIQRREVTERPQPRDRSGNASTRRPWFQGLRRWAEEEEEDAAWSSGSGCSSSGERSEACRGRGARSPSQDCLAGGSASTEDSECDNRRGRNEGGEHTHTSWRRRSAERTEEDDDVATSSSFTSDAASATGALDPVADGRDGSEGQKQREEGGGRECSAGRAQSRARSAVGPGPMRRHRGREASWLVTPLSPFSSEEAPAAFNSRRCVLVVRQAFFGFECPAAPASPPLCLPPRSRYPSASVGGRREARTAAVAASSCAAVSASSSLFGAFPPAPGAGDGLLPPHAHPHLPAESCRSLAPHQPPACAAAAVDRRGTPGALSASDLSSPAICASPAREACPPGSDYAPPFPRSPAAARFALDSTSWPSTGCAALPDRAPPPAGLPSSPFAEAPGGGVSGGGRKARRAAGLARRPPYCLGVSRWSLRGPGGEPVRGWRGDGEGRFLWDDERAGGAEGAAEAEPHWCGGSRRAAAIGRISPAALALLCGVRLPPPVPQPQALVLPCLRLPGVRFEVLQEEEAEARDAARETARRKKRRDAHSRSSRHTREDRGSSACRDEDEGEESKGPRRGRGRDAGEETRRGWAAPSRTRSKASSGAVSRAARPQLNLFCVVSAPSVLISPSTLVCIRHLVLLTDACRALLLPFCEQVKDLTSQARLASLKQAAVDGGGGAGAAGSLASCGRRGEKAVPRKRFTGRIIPCLSRSKPADRGAAKGAPPALFVLDVTLLCLRPQANVHCIAAARGASPSPLSLLPLARTAGAVSSPSLPRPRTAEAAAGGSQASFSSSAFASPPPSCFSSSSPAFAFPHISLERLPFASGFPFVVDDDLLHLPPDVFLRAAGSSFLSASAWLFASQAGRADYAGASSAEDGELDDARGSCLALPAPPPLLLPGQLRQEAVHADVAPLLLPYKKVLAASWLAHASPISRIPRRSGGCLHAGPGVEGGDETCGGNRAAAEETRGGDEAAEEAVDGTAVEGEGEGGGQVRDPGREGSERASAQRGAGLLPRGAETRRSLGASPLEETLPLPAAGKDKKEYAFAVSPSQGASRRETQEGSWGLLTEPLLPTPSPLFMPFDAPFPGAAIAAGAGACEAAFCSHSGGASDVQARDARRKTDVFGRPLEASSCSPCPAWSPAAKGALALSSCLASEDVKAAGRLAVPPRSSPSASAALSFLRQPLPRHSWLFAAPVEAPAAGAVSLARMMWAAGGRRGGAAEDSAGGAGPGRRPGFFPLSEDEAREALAEEVALDDLRRALRGRTAAQLVLSTVRIAAQCRIEVGGPPETSLSAGASPSSSRISVDFLGRLSPLCGSVASLGAPGGLLWHIDGTKTPRDRRRKPRADADRAGPLASLPQRDLSSSLSCAGRRREAQTQWLAREDEVGPARRRFDAREEAATTRGSLPVHAAQRGEDGGDERAAVSPAEASRLCDEGDGFLEENGARLPVGEASSRASPTFLDDARSPDLSLVHLDETPVLAASSSPCFFSPASLQDGGAERGPSCPPEEARREREERLERRQTLLSLSAGREELGASALRAGGLNRIVADWHRRKNARRPVFSASSLPGVAARRSSARLFSRASGEVERVRRRRGRRHDVRQHSSPTFEKVQLHASQILEKYRAGGLRRTRSAVLTQGKPSILFSSSSYAGAGAYARGCEGQSYDALHTAEDATEDDQSADEDGGWTKRSVLSTWARGPRGGGTLGERRRRSGGEAADCGDLGSGAALVERLARRQGEWRSCRVEGGGGDARAHRPAAREDESDDRGSGGETSDVQSEASSYENQDMIATGEEDDAFAVKRPAARETWRRRKARAGRKERRRLFSARSRSVSLPSKYLRKALMARREPSEPRGCETPLSHFFPSWSPPSAQSPSSAPPAFLSPPSLFLPFLLSPNASPNRPPAGAGTRRGGSPPGSANRGVASAFGSLLSTPAAAARLSTRGEPKASREEESEGAAGEAQGLGSSKRGRWRASSEQVVAFSSDAGEGEQDEDDEMESPERDSGLSSSPPLCSPSSCRRGPRGRQASALQSAPGRAAPRPRCTYDAVLKPVLWLSDVSLMLETGLPIRKSSGRVFAHTCLLVSSSEVCVLLQHLAHSFLVLSKASRPACGPRQSALAALKKKQPLSHVAMKAPSVSAKPGDGGLSGAPLQPALSAPGVEKRPEKRQLLLTSSSSIKVSRGASAAAAAASAAAAAIKRGATGGLSSVVSVSGLRGKRESARGAAAKERGGNAGAAAVVDAAAPPRAAGRAGCAAGGESAETRAGRPGRKRGRGQEPRQGAKKVRQRGAASAGDGGGSSSEEDEEGEEDEGLVSRCNSAAEDGTTREDEEESMPGAGLRPDRDGKAASFTGLARPCSPPPPPFSAARGGLPRASCGGSGYGEGDRGGAAVLAPREKPQALQGLAAPPQPRRAALVLRPAAIRRQLMSYLQAEEEEEKARANGMAHAGTVQREGLSREGATNVPSSLRKQPEAGGETRCGGAPLESAAFTRRARCFSADGRGRRGREGVAAAAARAVAAAAARAVAAAEEARERRGEPRRAEEETDFHAEEDQPGEQSGGEGGPRASRTGHVGRGRRGGEEWGEEGGCSGLGESEKSQDELSTHTASTSAGEGDEEKTFFLAELLINEVCWSLLAGPRSLPFCCFSCRRVSATSTIQAFTEHRTNLEVDVAEWSILQLLPREAPALAWSGLALHLPLPPPASSPLRRSAVRASRVVSGPLDPSEAPGGASRARRLSSSSAGSDGSRSSGVSGCASHAASSSSQSFASLLALSGQARSAVSSKGVEHRLVGALGATSCGLLSLSPPLGVKLPPSRPESAAPDAQNASPSSSLPTPAAPLSKLGLLASSSSGPSASPPCACVERAEKAAAPAEAYADDRPSPPLSLPGGNGRQGPPSVSSPDPSSWGKDDDEARSVVSAEGSQRVASAGRPPAIAAQHMVRQKEKVRSLLSRLSRRHTGDALGREAAESAAQRKAATRPAAAPLADVTAFPDPSPSPPPSGALPPREGKSLFSPALVCEGLLSFGDLRKKRDRRAAEPSAAEPAPTYPPDDLHLSRASSAESSASTDLAEGEIVLESPALDTQRGGELIEASRESARCGGETQADADEFGFERACPRRCEKSVVSAEPMACDLLASLLSSPSSRLSNRARAACAPVASQAPTSSSSSSPRSSSCPPASSSSSPGAAALSPPLSAPALFEHRGGRGASPPIACAPSPGSLTAAEGERLEEAAKGESGGVWLEGRSASRRSTAVGGPPVHSLSSQFRRNFVEAAAQWCRRQVDARLKKRGGRDLDRQSTLESGAKIRQDALLGASPEALDVASLEKALKGEGEHADLKAKLRRKLRLSGRAAEGGEAERRVERENERLQPLSGCCNRPGSEAGQGVEGDRAREGDRAPQSAREKSANQSDGEAPQSRVKEMVLWEESTEEGEEGERRASRRSVAGEEARFEAESALAGKAKGSEWRTQEEESSAEEESGDEDCDALEAPFSAAELLMLLFPPGTLASPVFTPLLDVLQPSAAVSDEQDLFLDLSAYRNAFFLQSASSATPSQNEVSPVSCSPLSSARTERPPGWRPGAPSLGRGAGLGAAEASRREAEREGRRRRRTALVEGGSEGLEDDGGFGARRERAGRRLRREMGAAWRREAHALAWEQEADVEGQQRGKLLQQLLGGPEGGEPARSKVSAHAISIRCSFRFVELEGAVWQVFDSLIVHIDPLRVRLASALVEQLYAFFVPPSSSASLALLPPSEDALPGASGLRQKTHAGGLGPRPPHSLYLCSPASPQGVRVPPAAPGGEEDEETLRGSRASAAAPPLPRGAARPLAPESDGESGAGEAREGGDGGKCGEEEGRRCSDVSACESVAGLSSAACNGGGGSGVGLSVCGASGGLGGAGAAGCVQQSLAVGPSEPSKVSVLVSAPVSAPAPQASGALSSAPPLIFIRYVRVSPVVALVRYRGTVNLNDVLLELKPFVQRDKLKTWKAMIDKYIWFVGRQATGRVISHKLRDLIVRRKRPAFADRSKGGARAAGGGRGRQVVAGSLLALRPQGNVSEMRKKHILFGTKL